MRTVTVLVALFLLASTVPGQRRVGNLGMQIDVGPLAVLDQIRAAYTGAESAERVAVTLEREGSWRASGVMTVQIRPGESGPERLVLGLDTLRALVEPGRVVAVATTDPTTVYRRRAGETVSAAVLAEHLPPLCLPQLALAWETEGLTSSPTPYTPDVKWSSGFLYPEAMPVVMELVGAGPSGPVTVRTASDGRLVRLTTSFDDGSQAATTLTLDITRLGAGEVEAWTQPEESRREVRRLSALRSTPSSGVGAPVGPISLRGPDFSAWTPADAAESAPDAGPARPRPIVIVFVRDQSDDAALDAALAAGARAHAGATRAATAVDPASVIVSAIVFELADFSPERLADRTRAWRERIGSEGAALLWATVPSTGLDGLVHDSPASIAVIDAKRLLRGSIAVDVDTPNLERVIAEALRAGRGD